jgi:arsenical pump membrane protein
MMLYIGNPTNIVVATAFRLHFDAFTKWMFLPTMAAGITSICLLYVVFQKEICVPFHTYPTTDPSAALTDKKGAGMGLGLMGGCILALALAPYVDLELWVISLIFALSLLVILVIREFSQKKWTKHELNSQNNATIATLRRMPWGVVPFILSLFIMVEALNVYGITSEFSSILKGICGESAILYSLVFGALSATLANLLNNIPMTVAFVSIMEGLTGNNLLAAAFATTIGSNLGANITPFGSLAGIMWLSILTTKNFRITFREFAFYGLLITPVTLLASLGVLGLEFYFM